MKAKKYSIQRTRYGGSIFMVLALVLIGLGEICAILSSRASNTYQLSDLTTLEYLTEGAIAALILVFVLSFVIRGRVYTFLFDVVRIAAILAICHCIYQMLDQRADLMGYIWFSDLEAGNETAINALNFGVYSAAFYLAGLIFLAITSGLEYVTAVPIKRTKEEVKEELSELLVEYVDAEDSTPY